MKVRDDSICAHCEHFTLRDLPAGTAAGVGRCLMRNTAATWSEPRCIVFDPAANGAERSAWIEKMKALQLKENPDGKNTATD